MPIITRPGEPNQNPRDSVLSDAYAQSDAAVATRFEVIAIELSAFAQSDFTQPVLGFDQARYDPLKREARQAMSELYRALERWRHGVATL